MRSAILLLCPLVAACGDNPAAVVPDAAPPLSCPTPSQPLAPGTFKLYLNTEGVSLTMGPCSGGNSQIDCSDVIAASVVVPPFLEGFDSRVGRIDAIVAKAQAVLAPFSIDIVTTRPVSGDYYMFVLGGESNVITGGACANCASITPYSCSKLNPNAVDMMFDSGLQTVEFYARTILSDLGAIVGMTLTDDPLDCMCRTGPECGSAPPNMVCTYSEDVAATAVAGAELCGRTTQDEPAILQEAFGCRE
jgi:hypothetical protein